MIYYNSNTINDWNFGDDNIIKVYKHGAVCYYKITSGDTPTPVQEPCFAVVENISQYSDTEFEDVFNKANGKWYKLNNLNQYEEYGLYGSGRNITYYDGKLTIDGDYEYQYSGGSWVNLGEVSGSSITIKSPEYIEKDSSHNGKINLDYVWKTNSKMQFKFYSTNNGGGAMIGENANLPDNNDCRMFFASTTAYFDWGSSRISWVSNGQKNTLYEYEYGNYYIKNMVTSTSKTGSTISTSRTNSLYLGQGGTDRFRTYYLKFYDGDTLVKDFIPWTDMNGNYGLFDKVSLSVYNVASGTLTGSSNVTDVEVGGGYEYPLEYPVIQDPPDNLVFSSMAEAEAYECPWVGMKATIDGDKYVFSGDSQSGYEWVENQHSLPDVPFVLNYNAKDYDASTHVITKTSGQLNDIDAVITGTTSNISDYSSDGYIRLTGSSSTPLRARVSNSSVNGYFNRSNTNPNLTIIAKILTQNSNTADDVLVNRDSNYNWMYRHKPSLVTLHGSSEQGSIAVSNTVPNICSARVASNRLLTYNNWTQNTTSTYSNFNYGGTTSDGGTLFASFATDNSYFWKGDFYWIYMSQNTLTDEQVQQVIDYNENL